MNPNSDSVSLCSSILICSFIFLLQNPFKIELQIPTIHSLRHCVVVECVEPFRQAAFFDILCFCDRMFLFSFSAFTVYSGPMGSKHLKLLFLPVCKVCSVLRVRRKHQPSLLLRGKHRPVTLAFDNVKLFRR